MQILWEKAWVGILFHPSPLVEAILFFSLIAQSPTLAEPKEKKNEFPNCDHGVYQLGLGFITDSTNK